MGRHGKPVPTARSPPATGSHRSRMPAPQVLVPGMPTHLCSTTPKKNPARNVSASAGPLRWPRCPHVHPLLEVNVPNMRRMGKVVLARPTPC